MSTPNSQLRRDLTLTDATSLVIGTIIGTGIFLKTAVMAQQLGTPALVLAAWGVAGLLSLAGALTYAELGALLPRAGGEYVYLRAAWGDALAFLYGWTRYIVGGGSVAAYGAAFAIFLSALFPLNSVWVERTFQLAGQPFHWQFGTRQVIAVAVILCFALVNCFGVAFGGRVQTILTAAKLAVIGVIVGGIFLFSTSGSWTHLNAGAAAQSAGGLREFGAAMLGALWAFSGWHYLPMAAGEVREPERNVPRALIVGIIVILAVYWLLNLTYFYALPITEVATANSTKYPAAPSVAAKAAQTFLGATAIAFVSLTFLISTVGSLNGALLSVARVNFAMARDGLFFARFGRLKSGAQVPAWSVMLYSLWGCLLAVSGTFDQLTNLAVFSYSIFWMLTASAVFVLRRKMPDASRPYHVTGYPIVPGLFVLVSLWLIVNTLRTNPVESLTALILMSLGLPLYAYFRHRKRAAGASFIQPGEKQYEYSD